jgi:hypothetical protein
MSLRVFHLVFIAASVMLSVVVGLWGFSNGSPVLGVLSFGEPPRSSPTAENSSRLPTARG